MLIVAPSGRTKLDTSFGDAEVVLGAFHRHGESGAARRCREGDQLRRPDPAEEITGVHAGEEPDRGGVDEDHVYEEARGDDEGIAQQGEEDVGAELPDHRRDQGEYAEQGRASSRCRRAGSSPR